MSYQVLARKWRPRDFSEVVGQGHVLRPLSNALDQDRLHHAFLFTGTRGVGKTTIARILAKCLNCEAGVGSHPCGQCASCREIDEGRFVDLLEVDAASRTKVEETRELLENVPYAPARGRYKVYLIDEVHMFSGHSFNALLKTLEEPPPHVKFLLATTDPQRLPVTILSRCLQFNLKRLPVLAIADHLARITEAEGVPADPAAHRLLAVAADGSVRDGLSLLDQAIAFGGGRLSEQDVRLMLGGLDSDRVYTLVDRLAAGNGPGLMAEAAELASQTPDYDAVLAELCGVLQRVAMAQVVPEALDDELGDRERVLALAGQLSPEDVQLYYQIGVGARRELPLAPDPRAGLEMTLLRMLAFRPVSAGRVVPRPPPAEAGGRAGRPPPVGPIQVAPSAPRKELACQAAPALAVSPPDSAGGARTESEPAWPEVVAGLVVAGLTRELANNTVLLGRDGDRLRLGLAPEHVHLRGARREAQLREALSARYGESVQLELVVGEVAAGSPAEVSRRDQAHRQEAAMEAIQTDPNVRGLREAFDAELVPGSVRPEE